MVKRVYQEEQVHPFKAVIYGDIPTSYENGITADWLTATVGRGHPEAKVVSFSFDAVDSGSFNRRRIFLDWNAAGKKLALPSSVFCKAAHDLVNRIILSAGGAHCETTFYNSIRPYMEIEAPQALFAGYDPVSFATMITLTDLQGKVTFATSRTHMTQRMVEQQLELLAKIHGRYYESHEDTLQGIFNFEELYMNFVQNHNILQVCEKGFEDSKNVIPPKLFARAGEISSATLKSVKRNGELPHTFAHGDLHLGNWYYYNDGRMGLADWQACTRGHWSRDVAYILATAPSICDRRVWEKPLVRFYLKALANSGGPIVSEEEAWIEIRRQLLTVLAYWTMTLTPSTDMPLMQTKETSLDNIERISTMMDDTNALGAF